MPATIASFSALRLSARLSRNTATAPCLSACKDDGRSDQDIRATPQSVLLRYERAAAVTERPKSLLGRDGRGHLEHVPFVFGFLRRFDLQQIHGVHRATVLPDGHMAE